MRLSAAGELSLVDTLRRRFRDRAAGLVLGIGDDAAVLRGRDVFQFVTTDMMVEGVHFDLAWATPFQIGYKIVSSNVSDIYAMGGRPQYLLLDFAADRRMSVADFNRLFDGIESALDDYRVALIGGDISSAEKLVLAATVIGTGLKAKTRGGARQGDLIYVTGTLGDSSCGLRLLQTIGRRFEIEKGCRPRGLPLSWEVIRPLMERQLMPRPKNPARYAAKATAMMDISDGLMIDLSRLCRESGVGAVVHEERLPISGALLTAAGYLGEDTLAFALGGGEDYELLFTAPPDVSVPGYCIGEITASGMRLIDRRGRTRRMKAEGYQHFAD